MSDENKMKLSQLISAEKMDEAYDKLHEERNAMQCRIETLETEKAALTQALQELCTLKLIKEDRSRKDEYETRKPKAWTAAFQVLDTLEA